MHNRNTRWLGAAIVALVLVAGSIGSVQAASKSITLGWTSWSDAEFMITLVKQQIEANTALTVNAKSSVSGMHYSATAAPGGGLLATRGAHAGSKLSIGVQYKAVANGDIDGMIMAWLPDTHKSYWKKVHADVIDLGPMYSGAIVGWAVPAYVSKAKIGSIADLKDQRIAKQLDGKIVGIDPDAGEMQESKQAMQDYGLEELYTLETGTDKSMTEALAHAIHNLDPIVVTLWTPHWANAKWDMRFLKDPKHEFGGPQHVDVIVRKGFRQDYPMAAKFLSNLYIPIDQLQHAMYIAEQTDEKTAVKRFVKDNPGLVASWWIGTGTKVSGAAADADISDN